MSEESIIEVGKSEPVSIVPAGLMERARSYAADAKAPRTRLAYRIAWRGFSEWCRVHGVTALPASPETVALFLTSRADAGRKAATLALELAAISAAHKMAGHSSPGATAPVRAVMSGIRRRIGTAQRRVSPLLPEQLRTIVETMPKGIQGIRDRALLMVGFSGALRRSELCALEMHDVAFTGDGLEVTIRRSKTDQEGAGRKIGLPYGSHRLTCPVRALEDWLREGAITEGCLWRPVDRNGKVRGSRLADRAVAKIVQRSVARIGLDPKVYAGHSLRCGLVTAAARAGKSEHVISKQTGHRSMVVLRKYIRDSDLFSQNAAGGIGL